MKITGNRYFQFFNPVEKDLVYWLRHIGFWPVNLFYRAFTALARPEHREKEFDVSLCLIYKNEAPYLREWIEFHRIVGVDHFFLYNNNSEDGHEDVLKPYVESGLVTLTDWPEDHAQVKAYEDCIRRFSDRTQWIGFIDADEFIVPLEGSSIADYLSRFRSRPAVLMYWRLFNSAGMLTRDRARLVTEDFVVASRKLSNKGKCFFNTDWTYLGGSALNRSMFHVLWTQRWGIPIPPFDEFGDIPLIYRGRRDIPVQLNHYSIRSKEEYMEKDVKGDVFFEQPSHGLDSFYKKEFRADSPDFTAFKYLSVLKERIGCQDPAGPGASDR